MTLYESCLLLKEIVKNLLDAWKDKITNKLWEKGSYSQDSFYWLSQTVRCGTIIHVPCACLGFSLQVLAKMPMSFSSVCLNNFKPKGVVAWPLCLCPACREHQNTGSVYPNTAAQHWGSPAHQGTQYFATKPLGWILVNKVCGLRNISSKII